MKSKLEYEVKGKDPLFKVWHASEDNMFFFAMSDGGSIVCNEKIYQIKKNVLCFIGAGKHHYTMPDEPKEYQRHKLFVSNEKLQKILALFSSAHPFIKIFKGEALAYAVLSEEQAQMVEEWLLILNEAKQNSFKFEEEYYKTVLELMSVISTYALETTAATSISTLQKAVAYINLHIYEQINIDDICNEIHISKSYLCRLFKQNMEMTIMNYILKTRLVLAKNMLLKEKLSIGEISEKCAFSSISYFCRVFKQEEGMSPLAYRRMQG